MATPASAAAGRNVRENTSMWRLTASLQGRRWQPTMNVELQSLDNRGVGHPSALTHGLQAISKAGLSHVVQHRRHDARARCPERVTQGDRPAPRVEPGAVGAG